MFMYKLMVVSAFESYKRGDYIYDQEVIAKINDPADLMHGYESKVRKMQLSDKELKGHLAPNPVVDIPTTVKAEEKPIELKIESIKDEKQKMYKTKESKS